MGDSVYFLEKMTVDEQCLLAARLPEPAAVYCVVGCGGAVLRVGRCHNFIDSSISEAYSFKYRFRFELRSISQ